MNTRPTFAVKIIVGILAGMAGALALVTLWHRLGLVTQPVKESYPYTEYLTHCVGWPFAIAYFVLNVGLGLLLRRTWPVALGMIVPLAIALGFEMQRDPTSHNLFPFEIVMIWMPAFGFAWFGANAGKFLVTRRAQPPVIPLDPPQ